MGIEIDTYLRSPSGDFTRLPEVDAYVGDARHVSGAIEFVVNGQPVLDRELWDDVDWLWPFVIQAIDECLTTGTGERYFPDQPIMFRVERVETDRLRFTVEGGAIHRVASADRVEILSAVGAAALAFFTELERLVPETGTTVASELARVAEWTDARGLPDVR